MLFEIAVPREDDASSTITVNGSDSKAKQPSTRIRRSVRIVEAANTYHKAANNNDCNDQLWYTAQDYLSFQRQAAWQALQLSSSTTGNALMRVYFCLRVATTVNQVQQVVEATDLQLDATVVGLHDRALPPLASDFTLRRRHLQTQIFHLQSSRQLSLEQRQALICETSLLSSHAARMYASFVAQRQAQQHAALA